MRNVLFSDNFAIMTAENPMHPVSMQGGNAALENELNKKGFKFHKIKGKYGGNPENSYLIENPDHQTIIDLGKKLGQDSVIVSKNGQHKMVYTNGPDAGKHHLGNSIETFEKPPEDYYSTGVDNGKPFHFSINFNMNTKHQDFLQKSESKYLVHFSNTPNLTELDPMMQGSAGRHSPETKHGRPEHPRVYFYEEGAPTESVVTGGAKSKYIVKHPGSDKIYDIAKDPHGLQQQAKEQWLQKPIGSMQDAYFKLLKDKGYMGFKNSSSGLPNVVALFHKTPVHAEMPAPADMSADKTWTEASVPMSLKKSSDMKKAADSQVKEAVEKIKGPARVNEVLAESPIDKRHKILAYLRKEKLEKMNGAGVSGAGGATPPMMRPPVPAAPAMAGLAMSKSGGAAVAAIPVAGPDTDDSLPSGGGGGGSSIGTGGSMNAGIGTGGSMNAGIGIGAGKMAMSENESKMAKKDLKDIMEYAQALDGMVVETEDLEDWVDSKIAVARQYLSDIAHYLSYEHGQPTEELDKGDVISMKDKKVISTDTQPAPKELVAQQPKMPKIKRPPVLIQTVKMAKSDSKKTKFERCVMAVKKKSGDKVNPWAVCHASVDGKMEKASPLSAQDVDRLVNEDPRKSSMYLEKHPAFNKKHIDAIVSQAPEHAAAFLHEHPQFSQEHVNHIVAKAPHAAAQHLAQHPLLTDEHKMQIAKVAPQAAGKFLKEHPLAKAEMSVKEQEKPTKSMPQAKQLKADADLKKIKEGAENVAKPTEKKKSELSKSTGYFKQNPKTQTPEWHDPLKQQREEAAKEEAEVRPEEKAHIWAMLEHEHQMSQKPKAQKPKEDLEKAKNYKEQREAVFGDWKSSESPLQREKKFKIINDFNKKHFGIGIEQIPQDAGYQAIREKENKLDLEKKKKIKNKQWTDQNEVAHQAEKKDLATQRKDYVQRLSVELEKQGKKIEDVLGKPNKAGIYINKPSMSNPRNNLQHMGTADSVIHEIAHLIYHGKLKTSRDIDRENAQGPLPHFQQDFQRHLDEILGKIQKKYKQYGQQWRTGHENGPLAIEQVLRRMMGFPAHQKEVAKQKDGSLKPEKQFSIENPNQNIVHVVKDKEGKAKWLTGKTANIKPHIAKKISKIFRKELEYTPEEGFVQGTSPDAKINIRAREAAKDKSRKDADTLMRSEELQKKLILGEGKPSKATKKATPEKHKEIMDKLSAALDTVKIEQSPEASEERKMLLEHVKSKLKGRK